MHIGKHNCRVSLQVTDLAPLMCWSSAPPPSLCPGAGDVLVDAVNVGEDTAMDAYIETQGQRQDEDTDREYGGAVGGGRIRTRMATRAPAAAVTYSITQHKLWVAGRCCMAYRASSATRAPPSHKDTTFTYSITQHQLWVAGRCCMAYRASSATRALPRYPVERLPSSIRSSTPSSSSSALSPGSETYYTSSCASSTDIGTDCTDDSDDKGG